MTQLTQSVSVSLSEITKSYGAIDVLQDVSLEVPSGAFTTLLGPSGSGKTTLLMVVAGFVRPERGQVFLKGKDVTADPPHKRDIGIVFQNYALFPHLDVAQNVGYPLRVRGVPRDEIARRVKLALEMVKMQAYSDRSVQQLSGGQRQRVALARAIVFEPRLLLMDEPLSALDKSLREEMQFEIKRLHNEWRTTTICVTHDQREALTMSDYVAVMNNGRIVQVDTPQKIYNRPSSQFVANFIGEASLVRAEQRDGNLLYNGRQFKVPADIKVPRNPCLVVRPERLVLPGSDASSDVNILEATVKSSSFQGDSCIIEAELPDGQQIVARSQSRHNFLSRIPDAGATVRFGLSPEDTIVVEGEPR